MDVRLGGVESSNEISPFKSSFHRLDTLLVPWDFPNWESISDLWARRVASHKSCGETHVFSLEHNSACGPSLDGSSWMAVSVEEDNAGSILGFIVGLSLGMKCLWQEERTE